MSPHDRHYGGSRDLAKSWREDVRRRRRPQINRGRCRWSIPQLLAIAEPIDGVPGAYRVPIRSASRDDLMVRVVTRESPAVQVDTLLVLSWVVECDLVETATTSVEVDALLDRFEIRIDDGEEE